MDIKPKFYLRDRNTDKATSIQLVVNFKNQKLKYGTGIRIRPILWDGDTFRPTTNKNVTRKLDPSLKKELSIIKNRLDIISKQVRKRYAYLLEQEIYPSAEELRNYLDTNLEWKLAKPKTKAHSLVSYFEAYISEMLTGKRTTDKGKRFAEGTIKNYQGCLIQFKDYQSKKRKKIQFEDVTMDLYDNLVEFFNKKNYSPNTIGRHMKNLKTIMRAALEEGLHENKEFQRKKFKTIKVDTTEIYLTEKEVKALFNLDLSKNKEHELIRDVFLVGVYTCQRYSDYSRIKKTNIEATSNGTKIVKLIQKKTGTEVQVPIRHELDTILKRYNYNLPKTYEQRVNKSIKNIAKMVGIDNEIQIEKIKGGLKVKTSIPKHDLIKTHTARRTGITNLYLAEIPSIAIQEISGHKTEVNLLKYIKVTKEQNADILAKHHYFTQPLKVAK